MRLSRWLWIAAALVLPASARAEHFDIKLTATAPGGAMQQAFADEKPPIGGLNPRPVLRVRAGDTIAIQFVMTNVYAHGNARDAGVRFYVVREAALAQKAVPPLDHPAAEGNFHFNLKPKARIGAKQRVAMSQPGNYLLRVESVNTQRDHEHFAAIDLEVR